MPTELDILAIEPFYGGERRAMLQTVQRHSRHRWQVLKLPARRLERRLMTASVWFAEILNKRPLGNIDLVFSSEILNLADLHRLVPWLDRKPSVVYFHHNQLPDPLVPASDAMDLVNLNSAVAAGEVWFNSMFHLRSFLQKATALVRRHPELLSHDPMPGLTGKAQLMQPAVDMDLVTLRRAARPAAAAAAGSNGNGTSGSASRRIMIETRGCDMRVLNTALTMLLHREPDLELITLGAADEVLPAVRHAAVNEADEEAVADAMVACGVYVSTRPDVPADRHAVQALAAGCTGILPASGAYPELLPEGLHDACLYDGSPEDLVSKLLAAWHQPPPAGLEQQQARILFQFDPDYACREMDDRFEELALVSSM